uniref:Uncharacterized protein n=1 Tax=Cacopsylla melanoneura TaxID=428564 RepID=A0A8D8M0X4_9HEMI
MSLMYYLGMYCNTRGNICNIVHESHVFQSGFNFLGECFRLAVIFLVVEIFYLRLLSAARTFICLNLLIIISIIFHEKLSTLTKRGSAPGIYCVNRQESILH